MIQFGGVAVHNIAVLSMFVGSVVMSPLSFLIFSICIPLLFFLIDFIAFFFFFLNNQLLISLIFPIDFWLSISWTSALILIISFLLLMLKSFAFFCNFQRWTWSNKFHYFCTSITTHNYRFLLVMRTFKTYSLSNFQTYNTVVLTAVSRLYGACPGLI